MFDHLQIDDPRERWLVGCADAALRVGAGIGRLRPRQPPAPDVRRMLLLRFERIGDLVMTLPALAALRASAPDAEIDLVVGRWNEPLARLIPGVRRREVLDAPWLARGQAGDSVVALFRRARAWRRRAYDLAINFEPDIRSNLLLALSGARRRIGFASRGGGVCLTHALDYDPGAHTSANALRLVEAAFPQRHSTPAGSAPRYPRLSLPDEVRHRAAERLHQAASGGLLIGVHASGGRLVKQWDPSRLGSVAAELARAYAATIVLTGEAGDRPAVDAVRAKLSPDIRVVDLAGALDLIELAAVLERLGLFITADTGPMHLAAAVGTPLVAIFGPSDPARWGPLAESVRIVRAPLWCSPCNRIRRPPQRCRGRLPDCLALVETDEVYRAAKELLDRRRE